MHKEYIYVYMCVLYICVSMCQKACHINSSKAQNTIRNEINIKGVQKY